MEHGYFEPKQGNVAPGRMVINAIGPQTTRVSQGREPALTLLPKTRLRVTGIEAILASAVVALWSAAFVHKCRGRVVLMLLSIL